MDSLSEPKEIRSIKVGGALLVWMHPRIYRVIYAPQRAAVAARGNVWDLIRSWFGLKLAYAELTDPREGESCLIR